ncbi:MAG: glutamine-hydrolyzing carbamoyl-phosphate synthase small subunit [Magnetococcales bacterium]|nr:glutamine-hydrolyzing carbamoyl-phosphate synthase small subunit [Magnetococcales bacterium]
MSNETTSGRGRAALALEDGTLFIGRSLGAAGESVGEVCFNTSMTGYQEIMTDPSYAGQIVTMTYTQIGNVGMNPEDMESLGPHIRGFVVKECSRIPSNWRSRESLPDFLVRHAIPAIEGIDTRQLVRLLRDKGAQRGVISTTDFDRDSLVAKAKAWPGLQGMNLTGDVTCKTPHEWRAGPLPWRKVPPPSYITDLNQAGQGPKHRVAVLDFGVKHNILRGLVGAGCDLTIFPATTGIDEILAMNPDGVFLSNGPGDPDAVVSGIETIKALLKTDLPLFGICLGHQMLSLALGAKTGKMKFGHRGGNHPVQDLESGKVEVTSQNHGFVVLEESLPEGITVTHRSLFDGTLEGIRLNDRPVFSVQHHPEASPGPHDASHLFQRFAHFMKQA